MVDQVNFEIPAAYTIVFSGGGQNFERRNVERPIFRQFETSNIKIKKVELFNFSIFEFKKKIYDCLNYSNTQNTYCTW